MKRFLWLLPLLLFATARPASAQLANAQGWCESGNMLVNTSGLLSTNLVQGSFPQCTVSVSIHGGGTATIFSTGASAPLSNPFTAATNGRWIFYAANGDYDITLTCTTPCVPPQAPLTNPFPVTYSDIWITNVTTGGGGGGSPASPFNSFQYNNAGSFGGAAGITTPDAGNSIAIHGPDPWFDLLQYGGYTSTSSPSSTTASCNGTTSITVASAIDFAVGQGIRVAQCGAGTVLSTPPTPTITPINITGGATTYSYQVSAEGLGGDLTAASSAGTTTSGQATLGVTTLALASASRTSGVTTYTLQAGITSLISGQTVNVEGFTQTSFDGVLTIASVPLSTTFTVLSPNLADNSETNNTATAIVMACNRVSMASNSVSTTIDTGGSGANVLRYWYWRNKASAGYALVGVATGADPYFEDCGQDVDTTRTPDYVPSTPLLSAQPGYLATTITNIAGTTFTLAASASQTISGQNAVHDNGPNIVKMAKAMGTNGVGGVLFIPAAISPGQYYFINSLVDLRSANVGSSVIGMDIQGWLQVNQPIFPGGNSYFNGLPAINGFSFNYGPKAFVVGNAIPIFFIRPPVSNVTFKNLKVVTVGNQAIGVFSDNLANGGGATGITFDGVGVGYGAQNYGSPITLKGGVDFIFRGGSACLGHSTLTWNGSPGCLRFTNSSIAFNTTNSQVPGRVQSDNLYCSILCVQIDTDPSVGTGGGGNPTGSMGSFNFKGGIYENVEGPFVRVRVAGSWSDFTFNDMQMADSQVGAGTPLVDAEGATSLGAPATFVNSTFTGVAPLFVATAGNAASILFLNSANGINPGNAGNSIALVPSSGLFGGVTGIPNGLIGAYQYLNGGMSIANGSTGKIGYALSAPTATTVTASAGGSWPTGTFQFAWTAVDWNNYETSLSNVFSLLVSTGSQTLASSCTPPTPGAAIKGFNLYWSNGGGFAKQNASPQSTCSISGVTTQSNNGTLAAAPANATVSSIDTNGLNVYKIKCGEGTAPSGQTGVDVVYCDSTNHRPEFINNNGSATIPTTVSAALTSGNIPKMATNGIDLVDSTFAPASFPLLICSGQIALTTGAIGSGARATNTLSCTGLSASTDSISCTFSGDTNAVTGYAPNASGSLSLKTWASTNTINVDQVNNTSGSITPGAATINCKGLR